MRRKYEHQRSVLDNYKLWGQLKCSVNCRVCTIYVRDTSKSRRAYEKEISTASTYVRKILFVCSVYLLL